MLYPLKFISEDDLERHIRETILNYSKSLNGINLKKFTSNIIDPIKMLFDSSVFNKDLETIIESEIIRQKDKTNNNLIGYFHQNLFKYINSNDWIVSEKGFDIVNYKEKIFVELKNKHNTMNSSSSQKTFINMQNKIMNDPEATCILVEVIAKKSQNIPWTINLNKNQVSFPKIRRMSVDRFYEIITGDKMSFYNLCNFLPFVIKKVINDMPEFKSDSKDTVLEELKNITSKNLLDALFKLSFKTYYGWNKNENND